MPPSTHTALRITLAGFLALAIAMGIGRFAFTPLLPMMVNDRLVTIPEGGVLASVHFLGYWLGAMFAARLTVSPTRALFVSLLVIGAATLGMGLTENFTLWLILRFLCGVCSAVTLVIVANHAIRSLAATGQARLQGWIFSGVGAGIALAGLSALAMMAGGIGSASSWEILGAVSLATGVAVCLLTGDAFPHTVSGAESRPLPRTPLAWSVIIAYGAAGIGYIIPATYLPVMAQAVVPTPLVFGWSWPVFGAAAFLSTLLSARLHTSFSNRQIWIVSQLVMAAGLLLPVLYPHIATVTAAGVCVGGTFMVITMAGMKEAHRIAATADVQRHIAALTASFATGQMIGPAIAGWIFAATSSFSSLLIITSIVLAVTATALTRRSTRELLRS